MKPSLTRHADLFAGKLLRWFDKNARDLPWRRTRDPYAVWVSEIMLQQTQVNAVVPYWERWMAELPTLRHLAQATHARIHKLWQGLGYYTRVRNMQKAAHTIIDQHGGQFPESQEALLALPGIGPYTAGALRSIVFDQPSPIVDGNVIRVLARVFCIPGDPLKKKKTYWQHARILVEAAAGLGPGRQKNCGLFNQALMELGALVCTPRSPACPICPVRQLCCANRAGKVGQFPQLAARPKITARRFAGVILERRGRVLLRQRPAHSLNAHLWEFPNVEVYPGENIDAAVQQNFGTGRARELLTIGHSITRYRITLVIFTLSPTIPVSGKWIPRNQLAKLAWTSAHAKVLDALLREKKTAVER